LRGFKSLRQGRPPCEGTLGFFVHASVRQAVARPNDLLVPRASCPGGPSIIPKARETLLCAWTLPEAPKTLLNPTTGNDVPETPLSGVPGSYAEVFQHNPVWRMFLQPGAASLSTCVSSFVFRRRRTPSRNDEFVREHANLPVGCPGAGAELGSGRHWGQRWFEGRARNGPISGASVSAPTGTALGGRNSPSRPNVRATGKKAKGKRGKGAGRK